MEGRRRSVSSEYEFRKRRTSGKMKVPLAMLLSFNDNDVHPDCPNISNPYHKCGRHCLAKIPAGRKYLDAIRSGGDQEWEKKEEKKGVNPNCPFASNPYHKCEEYCLEKLSEKRQNAGKDQPKKSKAAPKKTIKDKVHLNRSASDLNKLTVYVLEDIPKKEHLKGDMKSKKENETDLTTQRELSSLCKNASKPYHVCDEYCFQSVPERERYGQVIKLKSSKEGEKVMSNIESTAAKSKEEMEIIETVEQIVNLEYKNALNTSVVSPEYFFESVPEREQHEQIVRLKSTRGGDKFLNNKHSTGFDRLCKHASKPHHECTEFCLNNTPDGKLDEEVVKPKEESKIVVVIEQRVKLEGRTASNSNYVPAENGFQSVLEREQHKPTIKPKEESKIVVAEQGVKLEDRSVSNFDYVPAENGFQSVPVREQHRPTIKPKEESKIVVVAKQGVKLEGRSASNSDYVPSENGFQSVSETEQHRPTIKPKEESKIVVAEQGVKLQGRSASNSDYLPVENGFQSVPKREQHRPTIKPKEESKIVVVVEQGVKLQGKSASNSDYILIENGFQSVPKREQHRPTIKPEEESKIVVIAEQGVKLEGKSASNSDYVTSENGFQSILKREQHGPKKTKGVSFKIEKSSLLPDNKHLSNSYHEVIEDRFDDNHEQEHSNGVVKPNEERIVVTTEQGVDLLCKYSSNHYHESLMKSMEKEAVVPLERVNPQCKRASNPYHVCAKYCFQNVSNGHHPVQPMVKLKEEKKVIPSPQTVNLDCKYTSNPYHVCAEYCFENILERDPPKRTIKKLKEEDTAVLSSERRVNPECKFASNPYHTCAEYCFQNAVEGEQQGQVIKPKKDSKLVVAEQGVKLEGRSASNSDYVLVENSFESVLEREQHRPKKTKGVSFKFEKSSPLPDNKHILIPYHEVIEDRFDDNPEQKHPNGVVKPKERIVVTTEREVDLLCKYSSNNYHESLAKSMEKEVVVPLKRVNPQCKRASNPYHVCAEYCFQNVPNGHHPVQPIKKLKEEDTAVLSSERRVNPECKFASNPYHACAEYCFQNAVKGEQQGQVLKQKSLKELKKLVSNKKIASGDPHCEYSSNPYHQCAEYCFNKNVPGGRLLDRVMKTNERKKENCHALRRDDNPKYKNASKSFNRCSDYSPEETSPKSEAVEGSTATINMKKRNSSQGDKPNLPIAEKKISLNSKYMEASKAGQNYVESPERIILQDGTEKRGSMDETKDMQSVGIGEVSSTRNGNGNGDSENTMEKVEATGGFSRSIPILLFLILLAVFCFSSAPMGSTD